VWGTIWAIPATTDRQCIAVIVVGEALGLSSGVRCLEVPKKGGENEKVHGPRGREFQLLLLPHHSNYASRKASFSLLLAPRSHPNHAPS